MSEITHTQRQQLAVWLWFISAAWLLIALIVPEFDNETDRVHVRSGFIVLVMLVTAVVFHLWRGTAWRTMLDDASVDSVSVILAAVAAMAVWFIGWWLMLWLQHDVLQTISFSAELVNAEPQIYAILNWQRNWTLLIITDVVLLPLLMVILLWLPMRTALSTVSRLQASIFVGGLFGVLAMVLIGMGAVGFLGFIGYFMVGVLAAYVAFLTNSVWPAVAAQGVFAYFNFRFYDNMLRFVGIINDTGFQQPNDFLSSDMISAAATALFVFVVAVQFIRVRQGLGQGDAPSHPTVSLLSLLGDLRILVPVSTLILVCAFSFVRVMT